MENASKALIMAGGILIGVLILALMVTLFISSSNLSDSYDKEKQSEAIQQFNVNFTKYLGHDLTIHQVVTITNFAEENGLTINNGYTKIDMSQYGEDNITTYKLILNEDSYSEDGYIKSISFSKNN